jgi:hypothetical protein
MPARLLHEAGRHGQAQNDCWQVTSTRDQFWSCSTIVALRSLGGKLSGFGVTVQERARDVHSLFHDEEENNRYVITLITCM